MSEKKEPPVPKTGALGDTLRVAVKLEIKDPDTLLQVYMMLNGGSK